MKNTGSVKCPSCGRRQIMVIPEKACIPFYDCKGCGKRISAERNCCVFCDYGDRKCHSAHEK